MRRQWSGAGRFQKTPLLCLLWCYITASLFALSPARNGEQWAGCATRSSVRLAKSAAVFHAIVPHNMRIIQPTVTHSSQSGSHKRTPSCVYKKNVGHKGSPGAIWLKNPGPTFYRNAYFNGIDPKMPNEENTIN